MAAIRWNCGGLAVVAGTAELLPAAAAAAAGPARTSSTEPEILTAGLAPDGNIPEPDGAD